MGKECYNELLPLLQSAIQSVSYTTLIMNGSAVQAVHCIVCMQGTAEKQYITSILY